MAIPCDEIRKNFHHQKVLPDWAFPKVKAFSGERVETTKASGYRGFLAPLAGPCLSRPILGRYDRRGHYHVHVGVLAAMFA